MVLAGCATQLLPSKGYKISRKNGHPPHQEPTTVHAQASLQLPACEVLPLAAPASLPSDPLAIHRAESQSQRLKGVGCRVGNKQANKQGRCLVLSRGLHAQTLRHPIATKHTSLIGFNTYWWWLEKQLCPSLFCLYAPPETVRNTLNQ